jgi:glycosyltransferase involved in cell wall biosynthesis
VKIIHVLSYFDKSVVEAETLLKQQYTITGIAENLAQQGVEVIVVNRFNKNVSFIKNNVQYHLIKDADGPVISNRRIPWRFLKQVSSIQADVVHFHHLSMCSHTFLLRLLLPRKTAIVVQHHGGVHPSKVKRYFYNLLNNVADGFFFTTLEQGHEWFMKKKYFRKIMPVMEGATFFSYNDRDSLKEHTYEDRSIARRETGIQGSPVFLWVGRLDENKDPLTVLGGMSYLFDKHPQATLYMIFNSGRLLSEVTDKVNSSPALCGKVHMLNEVPHEEIETYYKSADYFVLGSHYEGSGYALSEALRCGCIPIVTDIPSFRMMTNNGELGALWEPGNKDSFANATLLAMKKPIETEAGKCIDFFKQTLSFNAIAKVLVQHYQQLADDRHKKNSGITSSVL